MSTNIVELTKTINYYDINGANKNVLANNLVSVKVTPIQSKHLQFFILFLFNHLLHTKRVMLADYCVIRIYADITTSRINIKFVFKHIDD